MAFRKLANNGLSYPDQAQRSHCQGLDARRLHAHWRAIKKLAAKTKGITTPRTQHDRS
jgi:hypothetical protein